jgi:CheY-like chemotaxis protein
MSWFPAGLKTTILVVEDDPGLRALYQRSLRAVGYNVVAVEDGVDALRYIDRGGNPQVIVLDLMLPRLSGRDLHQELTARDATSRIPFVVVTGTDTSDVDEHDFACLLRKPVHSDTLINAVAKCLHGV